MTAHDLARKVTECRTKGAATDRRVLGPILEAADAGRDFVEGDNNYTWWDAIGEVLKPRSVLEIGVRYGYSLKCLLNHTPKPLCVLAVDCEYDGAKTNSEFERHFRRQMNGVSLTIVSADSQTLTTLPACDFDAGSVDGRHDAGGCKHDCELVFEALRPGGVMVVDDTLEGGEPRQGCEEFCREHGLEWAYLPSLRGIHLVVKPG